MADINWKLNDDLKTVTLTLPTDPQLAVTFDLPAVEAMVKTLGDFRARMTPEVPKEFALEQQVRAILDPVWVTEPEARAGDSLLHLRDTRYGWLHYLFPRAEARKLLAFLQKQVDLPPPEQSQGKPS
jgi:hypothetical protein